VRTLFLLPALILSATASAATYEDFDGPYAVSNWTSTGIYQGIAGVDAGASSTTSLELFYDVDLGYPGPGVTFRTTDVQVQATVDGVVAFDWDFTYDHRIYMPDVVLTVWAEDASGVRQEQTVHTDTTSFGSENATGSVTGLDVYAGHPFGITMGGGNLDVDSQISGTLLLTSFELDALDVDCAGIPGGPNEEDFCGTCDANPYNDCVQDCEGVFGGDAYEDACGTCDDDPTNDCGPDCNGDYGGGAVEDMCGTCDTDPTNDCEQDCAGEWGGDAEVDNCGTCNDDPSDDCEQDCAGEWGGAAFVDECGVCVGGVTGLEPCDPDTGTLDTGTPGSTPSDTGPTDTGAPSTGSTTTPSTGGTTTPTPTTPSTFDTAAPEVVSYNRVGGCGCASGSPAAPLGLAWLALVALPLARRRA